MGFGRSKQRGWAIEVHREFLQRRKRLPEMHSEMFSAQFGEKLVEARKLASLSVGELSKMTGISSRQISNWEEGKDCIDVFSLFKIIAATGVPPNDSFDIDYFFEFAVNEFER